MTNTTILNNTEKAELMDKLVEYLQGIYKEEREILNFAADYYNDKLPKEYSDIVKNVYNENIPQIVDDFIDFHNFKTYPSEYVEGYFDRIIKRIKEGESMRDLGIEILEYLEQNFRKGDALIFKYEYENGSSVPNSIKYIFKNLYHENVTALFDEFNDYLEGMK